MAEKVSNWEDTYDEGTDRTILDNLWDEDVNNSPAKVGKLHYTLSGKYVPKSWRVCEKLTDSKHLIPPHVYYEDIPGTTYCYRDVIHNIKIDYSGDNLIMFYELDDEFYEEYSDPFQYGNDQLSKNYPYPNDIAERLVMLWIEDWKTKTGVIDGRDFIKDVWHSDILYNFSTVWENDQLRYTLCNLICGLYNIPFQKIYNFISYQLASQSYPNAISDIRNNVDGAIEEQRDTEVLWTCAEMFNNFINSDEFREAIGERKSWQTEDPDDYDDDDYPYWLDEEE